MTAYLEFLFAMALAKGLLHVPASLAYLAGESLGSLAYRLDRKQSRDREGEPAAGL